jgi:phosphopantothenoylcysteine decarboxylase/phosphopantothenate--cysteine ligase
MQILDNKNILLGVSGSIAVYKALELTRLYKKAGANVKVIMSNSAKKFVTPLAFETISQNTILDDTNEDWSTQTSNNHIAIGKWADIMVIAPATANTINKLSNGYADTILTQVALAYPGKKLLCPAANTNMIQNPMTQESIGMLKKCNYDIVNSISKELACKDVGDGALAEVEDIFHATCKELLKTSFWENRNVVLSGGGTREKIDEVRYISNFSSGKMANAMATALFYKGANVTLVSSASTLGIPSQIQTIFVEGSIEMQNAINDNIKKDDSKKSFFFSVAAVSDFVPKNISAGKLKKDTLGQNWDLELTKNIDILNSIDKENIYTIGFKAEMDKENAKQNALNMLNKKNLDAVCLNILEDSNSFGTNSNAIEFINKDLESENFQGEKLDISLQLIEHIGKSFE